MHAHFNRGISRDKMGDQRGAISDFTAAIQLDPANASVAYYNRAAAYDATGQFDKAVGVYRLALDAEK